MAERRPGTSGWLRGLLGGGEPASPPAHPGREALMPGGRAAWTIAASTVEVLHAVEVPQGGAPRFAAVPAHAFGGPVRLVAETDARAAAAGAVGAAVAGRRAAAFVPAEALPGLVPLLRSAARRHVPVTVVAALEPTDRAVHDPFHAAARAGVPVFVARDGQNAVDLLALAVRVAEETLTPVVVGLDGPSAAWGPATLRMPEADFLRSWLGEPGDAIAPPTVSQASLFGARRRRVPRWFDPDRPALTGATLTGPAADAGAAAERVVIEPERNARVAALASEYEASVGRTVLSIPTPSGEAPLAIVALGDDVGTVRAAVAAAGYPKGSRPTVLALGALEPFPDDAVRAAGAGAGEIVVLDRSAHDRPLAHAVRLALSDAARRAPRVESWTWSRPDGASLLAALAHSGRPADLHLGVAAPGKASSAFPKRQIALQRLDREHPGLAGRLQVGEAAVDLRPAHARSVWIATRDAAWPAAVATGAAEALSSLAGPFVAGRTLRGGHGHWIVSLTAAPAPFPEPGDAVVPDAIVALDPEPAVVPDAPAGTPVLARARTDGSPDLPPEWLRAVRDRGWRAYVVADLSARVGHAVREALAGSFDGAVAVEPTSAPTEATRAEASLPAVVRRFERADDDWAGLPRFWSEQVQPGLAGETRPAVADPAVALRAVPPYTATLDDRSGDRERTPEIDVARCTACGRCWTSCPEAAILPVAFGATTLLETAAAASAERLPDPGHAAVGKIRRAAKSVAAKLDARVAREGARRVSADDVRAAYHEVVEKLGLDDADRVVADGAVDGVVAWCDGLPMASPDATFHAAHRSAKGTGSYLLLAVDPAACNGCGVCTRECADDAIGRREGTGDLDAMRRAVRAWEALPDTPGETVQRMAAREDVGPMSAILMSRHASSTVLGGGDSAPGSGARLAVRLTTAAAEAARQPRVAAHLRTLAELAEALRGAVREEMAQVLDVPDLDVLDRALDGVARRPGNAGEVVERLAAAGESPQVDTVRARRLLNAARRVEDLRRRWAEGDGGQGRARFALVVAGRRAAAWAAGFPHNPFGVPATVDEGEDGADVAAGIARALIDERVEEARAVREARVLLDDPADLPAREAALARLAWDDLDADERGLLPRTVLLVDGDALRGAARAGIPRLIAAGLPATVLAVDDGDPLATGPDPVLTALAHRDAYVVSGSPSHPDLLFRGAAAALTFDGPSFVHVLAPEPGLHGFPTDATVERARRAVRARVQPLVRYDPAADGVFGLRLDLDGNPAPDAALAGAADEDADPASWAAGEERYRPGLEPVEGEPGPPFSTWSTLSPDARSASLPTVPGPNGGRSGVGATLREAALRRLDHWRTLQELAGIETPFTARVRDRVVSESEDRHREAIEALRREYEARLAEQRASLDAEQVERLRDRLLQLAGYDPSRLRRSDDGAEGGS